MGRLLTSALLFLIAIGIFFFFTKPTYDTVSQTKAEIAQYDAALTKAAELQTLKQALLAKFNAFNPSDIDRLQKMVPDHVDNIRLILDFDSVASRYGMALENVDVSAPQAQEGDISASSVGLSNLKYDSLTFKFSTHGTYNTFQQFMSDLQSSLRIVDLTGLSIAADAAAKSPTGEQIYRYNVTLRTYWLK